MTCRESTADRKLPRKKFSVKIPYINERIKMPGGFDDAIAKSHVRSFEVLQKSKTGKFPVVTLRVVTLKIPDFVFFAIHQKFLTVTFGNCVFDEAAKCSLKDIFFSLSTIKQKSLNFFS